jgi:hypothetical protein
VAADEALVGAARGALLDDTQDGIVDDAADDAVDDRLVVVTVACGVEATVPVLQLTAPIGVVPLKPSPVFPYG